MVFSCRSTKEVSNQDIPCKTILDKYARILEVNSNELHNLSLYQFIDDWNGVSYKLGGITQSGIDCSGFCQQLYANVYQKEIPRTTSAIYKSITRTSKDGLTEGDLVFFTIAGKKNSHVGVYLHNNRFVHASTSKGVIISSMENPYYKNNFNQGGKIK